MTVSVIMHGNERYLMMARITGSQVCEWGAWKWETALSQTQNGFQFIKTDNLAAFVKRHEFMAPYVKLHVTELSKDQYDQLLLTTLASGCEPIIET